MRVLETYRIDPGLIQEHANGERRIKEGGYGDRQIYELVQNGADELRNEPGGEIAVVLTDTHLYCANQGTAMSPAGADTILRMGVSRKRGGQIGRFGVGVKSVLSVTDVPEFFSKEDDKSFGFDREWAEMEIRRVRPDTVETPVLRMARPLDRDRAMAADPILAELLTWATTVVRLPLKPAAVPDLVKDIDEFPAEFTLFSPHVGTITLEKRLSGRVSRRQIFQHLDGDRRTLQRVVSVNGGDERDETEEWRVFTRVHRPSARALTEAGELHDRPEIDISWAVPHSEGRAAGRGQFWAYFPTNYELTLRGIVNAPWKTSEDRQNLYAGNQFNEELIDQVADLVVSSLPALSQPDDPCSYLDFVPARGREEPQWAAKKLVKRVWEIAAGRSVFPDQNGRFDTPARIRVHPDGLQQEWLDWWAGYSGRPVEWIHHSADSGRNKHRRDSVKHILSNAVIPIATVKEWLEALVSDGSAEASSRAVLIAASMKGHPFFEEASRARIVLIEGGGMVAPSSRVFRRSKADRLADNTVYVDERVYEGNDIIARALETLNIHEANHRGRFASVVERGFQGYNTRDWTAFWDLARLAGPEGVRSAFRGKEIDTAKELKVKTLAGDFRRIRDCLLPGPVVPADGSRDAGIAVDLDFHSNDRAYLAELGLLSGPILNVSPGDEEWFQAYKKAYWELYLDKLPKAEARPSLAKMHFDGTNPAGPLHLFISLSKEGRAAFLKAIPSGGAVTQWTMQPGNKGLSSRVSVSSPIKWLSLRYGHLRTSRGLLKIGDCVSPELSEYRDVLPVADVSTGVASMLNLPSSLGDLRQPMWDKLVAEASASTDDRFPGRVYALMFEVEADFPEGAMTRCRVGDEWRSDVPDTEIAVTHLRTEYDALLKERVPALLVPTDSLARTMREAWHMLSPAEAIQTEYRHVEVADPVPLIEEFPYLKTLRRAQVEGWSTIRCEEVEEITRTPGGMRTSSVPFAVLLSERKVLVRMPADDLQILTIVDRVLKLGLGQASCRAVLERREQERNNERVLRIRQTESMAEKLLLLIGVEALKNGLPDGLLESDRARSDADPSDLRIAELAHNSHRTEVLRVYRKDIEVNFPQLAAGFRGDATSVRIVNDLGFPGDYAGSRQETLPPLEKIPGPTAFPRLHDYQERLARKTVDLLTKYDAPRAMLCLPTGAGKTRVAAEAVIRVIRERGLGGRPVLWIAQNWELCEQAVQSWSFVWGKVGPGEQLVINRLWASHEAAPSRDTAQLVVATDAKLAACLDKDEYSWLRDPALVIVDEAHVSITKEYTQILRSLGLTARETSRPLLGLTATPFRGKNEAETNRLVERYGGNRLDMGVFESDDPYAELQELGVLAQVDHRQLTGMTITLSEEDLRQVTAFDGARLPSSVEEKLGRDIERNEMLIREIKALPEDSPILLFATSVNHAKLMAAQLNDMNISAASIDSATPMADRRNLIEKFRSRQIRVIANYSVLAQGFDAPATEVVIVSRPTFSPNVYQQMIGRGLRGPKNGGKDTCLILDVADNIINYDRKLAFRDFEHLWGEK
ncbi:DEAD/DEAH box helicase [Herbidospora galbida]|uniref:DEAD/DEAH box helicase n=2 Tax=Herbidospora galbida TaxID=2575442 RepID=A0A4U3MBS7_9ACTN|nr:DEAD/DEAH box helicase [Herbidospora galbida]